MVRPPPKAEERGPKPSLFKETPGSVKTLRRLYKDRVRDIDPQKYMAELDSESDRAVIILMAANLDDSLAQLIAEYFCFVYDMDDIEHAFRFQGPLGSFSNRLEIAVLFGMIDDRTYQQLDTLRELRNACAHSRHSLAFDDVEMVNVVARFFAPIGSIEFYSAEERAGHPGLLRKSFVLECHLLNMILDGISRDGAEARVEKMFAAITKERDGPPSQDK